MKQGKVEASGSGAQTLQAVRVLRLRFQEVVYLSSDHFGMQKKQMMSGQLGFPCQKFLVITVSLSELSNCSSTLAVFRKMKTVRKIVVVLALLSSVAASSIGENEVSYAARQPRTGGIIKSLLPFINLKIKNPFECRPGSSVNGYPVLGTCMSQYDCETAGGEVDGECASGYGRCCVLSANCGDTITRNRTYIISNSTTASTCTYTISKEKLGFKTTNQIAEAIGACQVRLDFEEFVLNGPDVTTPASISQCIEDSFEITGNQNAFGKICGNNEGQHIYLPITSTSDTIATINIVRSATSTVDRKWRIRVTYIPCLSNMTAPPGCLQYFTEDTGVIKSFNYVGVSTPPVTTEIGSLEYTACISEKIGSCAVSLTPTLATAPQSFHVSGVGAGAAAGVGAATCATLDYIAILAVDATGVPRESIYCGGTITTLPITTYVRPFSLFVRTDDTETATDVNTGFSFTYSRVSC
ncbi:CUB domain [Trinorchestia longiramus]|nr:CUB domain [Trinorchestia longiramus]